MVEHCTAIKAATILLDATITLTIIYIFQQKTMPYLHILQFVQLYTIVEVMLKELTY